jgi:hypothetical protein
MLEKATLLEEDPTLVGEDRGRWAVVTDRDGWCLEVCDTYPAAERAADWYREYRMIACHVEPA